MKENRKSLEMQRSAGMEHKERKKKEQK